MIPPLQTPLTKSQMASLILVKAPQLNLELRLTNTIKTNEESPTSCEILWRVRYVWGRSLEWGGAGADWESRGFSFVAAVSQFQQSPTSQSPWCHSFIYFLSPWQPSNVARLCQFRAPLVFPSAHPPTHTPQPTQNLTNCLSRVRKTFVTMPSNFQKNALPLTVRMSLK